MIPFLLGIEVYLSMFVHLFETSKVSYALQHTQTQPRRNTKTLKFNIAMRILYCRFTVGYN